MFVLAQKYRIDGDRLTRFEYKAKDMAGKTKVGSMAAENLDDFYAKLREQKLFCMEVQETATSQGDIGDMISKQRKGHKLKLDLIAIFCRQFATMLGAGITVVKCLDILYHQADNRSMKTALVTLYESIKKGNSLSSAMKDQGSVFPMLLINMIQSGEASGKLDDVMFSMSAHFEKEKALKNKIRAAMIYPIVLIFVSVIVVAILLIQVVPTFMELFGSQENMPASTRILIGTSDFLKVYWWLVLIFIVGAVIGFGILMKNPVFKTVVDRFKIKIPKIGKLMMIVLTARFARTVSTLYSSGVPIIDSIRISANVLGNLYIAQKLELAIDDIKRGVTLSQALTGVGIFPTMFCSMVYIGEESGTLDEILQKTADFYDEDSGAAIARMVALMEPIMIVVLGLIVAFIVVSIAQPMFGMYDHIV